MARTGPIGQRTVQQVSQPNHRLDTFAPSVMHFGTRYGHSVVWQMWQELPLGGEGSGLLGNLPSVIVVRVVIADEVSGFFDCQAMFVGESDRRGFRRGGGWWQG